jgi:GNAT superfamily N-acetyltransferase
MAVRVDESLDGIDWVQAKAGLAADDFDNGRSPQALRASFDRSQHVAIAWDGDRVVGMARLLSDGVCNAYLLDVWTMSAYRRQGIGTTMVRQLMSRVPGQHIGLQTDHAEAFYVSIGYRHQPVFMSAVVGEWLANEANARLQVGCWKEPAGADVAEGEKPPARHAICSGDRPPRSSAAAGRWLGGTRVQWRDPRAKPRANDRRPRDTPGHSQPRSPQLDGTSGHSQHPPATLQTLLTSEGSLVRTQLRPRRFPQLDSLF